MDPVTHAYARLMQRLGHEHWFAAFSKSVGCKLDRLLFQLTGCRFGLTGAPQQTMLLSIRGRKSGRERTVIVFFVHDGRNLVAACEDFGLATPSSWPKNLLANPMAQVQIGRSVGTYHARLATAEESARALPALVKTWPAHETYRRRTGRQYVFVFEPVNAAWPLAPAA
jgi:deazaflavin-dependent oxidoreductase (nitroreductase family)